MGIAGSDGILHMIGGNGRDQIAGPVFFYAVSAFFSQSHDDGISSDGVQVCGGVLIGRFLAHDLCLQGVDVEERMKGQHPLCFLRIHVSYPGPGGVEKLQGRMLLQIFNEIDPGGLLDLQAADVGEAEILCRIRLHPFLLEGIFYSVIGHEGPLPAGLHQAVAAAVFFFRHPDGNGDPRLGHELCHIVSVGAAAHRRDKGVRGV